ncbi:2-amino-4-hydroxy-6-hydroxymethyldihydropteridine diphosphokinase [Bifidobacterium pseudocatenulatum]|uniref:2-amino-4-hydroxy-6- hydroxymethyldihydropteridine diphosphokinase n=1 Tax=Bifidobacterium pseudocatenulatum TaxID=28026 RepID=UPI0031EE4E21
MDQIRLTGVRAVGKHGVLDFEHERAQTFVVDATLFLDLAPAGHSDDLHDTVDYGAIAKGIVAIIEGEHVDLIEKLADRIANMILEYPAVAQTQVTVHKPSAPIVVPFDDVSVTVERSRETTLTASQVHHAIIAMGGNQGDVVATLRDAVRSIDGLASTQVTGVSPLYRTDAWGMPDGTPEFHNAVVSVNTRLSALELLRGLQRIEAEHGRVRTDHWTSRTLDLDIIDFDGQESDDPDLTLPHPRAWQRAFVLRPWLALEPDAELQGEHAGSVAQLLHESTDRDHIDEIADDWMVGGTIDSDHTDHTDHTDTEEIDESYVVEEPYSAIDAADLPEGTAASKAAASASVQSGPASRRAVISLDSPSTKAEQQFRMAIVALDGIPGNQVEGISPLYHVSQLDGLPDKMAAVMQISTRMGARDLIETLGNVEASISGDLDLDLIDMEGVTCDEPDCKVPWPTARNHAAVLAPWLDMDPDARLGKDPVSFLLAMAPDTAQVGLLTGNWIIGGEL